MNKKKILMAVANEYAFDGRVQRAVEALKDDFEIRVVAFKSDRKPKTDGFSLVEVEVPSFKENKGIKKIISNPIIHLYFWLRIFIELIKFKPYIFYGHDFFMAFPGFLISLFTRVHFIYDAHELIVPSKQYKLDLELNFWYFLEKLAIRRAKLIITANEERARIMKEFYGLEEMPVHFRNISKVHDNKESTISETFPITKKENDLFVIYQGFMDISRGLMDFINAMRYLDETYKLILIGYGKDYEYIKSYIRDNFLDNKIFMLEKVPRKHLPMVISMCDIGIVAYGNNSLNEEYCEPNKLYDYTQLGLPVICTCQTNLKKIIEKYNIGMVTCCDKTKKGQYAQEIANCLIQIRQNLKFHKSNIELFLRDYNWEVEKERLLSHVKKL